MDALLDRLLNKFDQAAKDWGAAASDESVENKKLLRIRRRYYDARRALFEYTAGLSRTAQELAGVMEQYNEVEEDRQHLLEENERLKQDRERLIHGPP